MYVRIISQKVVDITAEGTVITFVEGYCDSEAREQNKLPTTNIAGGSNFIETDSGNWDFFDEATGNYNIMLNIME